MATKAAPQRALQNGSAHAEDINCSIEKTQAIQFGKPASRPHRSPARSKKSVEDESLIGSLCAMICNHQLGLSVNLLLLLALTHTFFPRARRRTTKFFRLSYYNSDTGEYGLGSDDLAFVALWVTVITGLRVAVMEYFLAPLARLGGIKTRKGLVRFQEQGWLIVYYTFSWSLGMYIMYHSEFWFNLNGMWKGWPVREVTGLHKWYYLVQWGSYLQQIFVVHIEEKRKDYAQMLTHHIFTSILIFLSYGYYHMRVGTVILCIMDLVDIVLPTAKLLKYVGFSTACDVMFGVFLVAWVVTRQTFFPMVCWSIFAHTPTAMAPGCYLSDGTMVPANDTEQYNALGGNEIWSNIVKSYTDRNGPICWNPTIRYSFLGLLLALQFIILLWFVMILKVVWKVVRGQNADDVRSDDEGEEEEIEVKQELANLTHPINATKSGPEWVPVEEEVGVEALNFSKKNTSSARNYKRSNSTRSSGISIPGHGDRKELLGRIGCDKPT